MIIRTGLDEIRSIGRNTQGVRLIKLKPEDKLVAAEKIASEEGDDARQRRAEMARNGRGSPVADFDGGSEDEEPDEDADEELDEDIEEDVDEEDESEAAAEE